jgi:hypothetical protein
LGSKKCTTFPIWWLIVLLLAISSILADRTLSDWGSIWAIIAGALAVGIVIWQVMRWLVICLHSHQLFYLSDGRKNKPLVLIASSEPKRIKITLHMKISADLQFMNVGFIGNGQTPILKEEYMTIRWKGLLIKRI